VLNAELSTEALRIAGAYDQLQSAQWLRQYGAEWPTALSHGIGPNIRQWSDAALIWARAQGCTAPILDANNVSDNGNDSNNDDNNEE
jgi:hypothetical protein